MMRNLCVYQVIVGVFLSYGFGFDCEKPIQKVYCREGQQCGMHFSVAAYLQQLYTFALRNYNGTVFGSVTYFGGKISVDAAAGTNLNADLAGNIWLNLLSVQSSSAGTYIVATQPGLKDPCATVFILGKPTTPSISKDKDPSVGESVTLTCSSMSTTTPSNHSLSLVYKWTVDGVDDPIDSRYTYSALRHTITLSSVVKDDADKKFTCTSTENVTDGYTSARSTVVSISVFYGPGNLTFSPSAISYELEENTELPQIACNAACNPVCSFLWIKQATVQQVSNNNVLMLGSLQASEAGTYSCIATRSGSNSDSKNLTVNVIYGPSSVVLSPSGAVVRQDEGTVLSLRTCIAQCWQCEYRWSGPGGYSSQGPVLNLGILNRSEHGEYTCTATNTKRSGPAKTVSTAIEVRYGPDSVVLSPANTTYTVDELDRLGNIICSADCFPPCSFTWNKKGQGPNVSNTATLPLGIIQRGHMGIYICTAQNTEISPVKSAFTEIQLYVRYGPYPESTTLSPAQTAYTVNENDALPDITCHADCYPDCSYIWTKRRDGLPSVVSRTAVLSLKTVNRTDVATYICSAVNEHTIVKNSTQKEVRVTVNYGPDGACDNVSSHQTFTEGDSTASIRCSSECYPGCSYTWSNGSGQLSNSEILSLGSVRRYQAGNYTFSVRNTAQTYSKSAQKVFNVVVKYAPVVSAEFSTKDRSEGTSLTLFCRGKGVPPVYSYRGLTHTVAGVQVPNTNTALEGTETYSSLHFSKLQLQDTGNYTCIMNNGILDLNGTLDQTETVQLLTEVKPKILGGDRQFTGTHGNSVSIKVPFYCYPALQSMSFIRHDGIVIQNDTRYKTLLMPSNVRDVFYGKEVTLPGYLAILTITDLEDEDFVNYTLTLRSSIGATSEIMFIIPERLPGIPRQFFLTSTMPSLLFEKGSNGGQPQVFVIEVSVADLENWISVASIFENDQHYKVNDTFYKVDLNLDSFKAGTYTSRLIAKNIYGATEPLNLNRTFTIESERNCISDTQSQVSGVAAGVAVSVVVIVIVVAVITVVVVLRRKTGRSFLCFTWNNRLLANFKGKGRARDTMPKEEPGGLQLSDHRTGDAMYESLQASTEANRQETYESITPIDAGLGHRQRLPVKDTHNLYANMTLK